VFSRPEVKEILPRSAKGAPEMDPINVNRLTTPTSPRGQIVRLIATLVLGAAMGAVLTFAVLTQLRPASATPLVGVAVTDGWAHSPITRLGSANTVTSRGVAVTDGWAHSPITRAGGSDGRAAQLGHLAISYQQQGPAAEARAR
jgi:hypothetical protein